MSNGLAIAGVTFTLQYYLNSIYSGAGPPFSQVDVTCLAPDQVQSSLGDLTGPENQVNLFLHQVTYNSGWRNVGLPSLDSDGKTRLQSPPLALDLHYLLTVYASDYWQAEALLGYAVMMLHENPVLVRQDIANALAALSGGTDPYPTNPPLYPTNPLTSVLGSCGIADQVEMLKITPETLGREEMAWLWTALKADYRPTFPFQVTVVLMQPQQQTSVAPPVITRSVVAQPQQPAEILQVSLAGLSPPWNSQTPTSTDSVLVTGEFLSAVGQVQLTNERFGLNYTVPVTGATNTSFTFVPNAALTNPAGMYTMSAQLLDSTGAIMQSTTPIDFPIAPTLPAQTALVVANAEGSVVTVSFSPNVIEGQQVSLVLSATTPPPPGVSLFTCSAPAQAFTGSVASLSFQFPATLPTGALLGQLLVDGVPSQLQANASPPPPFSPVITI